MTITLGELLQKTRDEKGLNMAEAAYQTKIREHYLSALENNQIDLLPSKVQGKGYFKIYCQFLGLDEKTMIDAWNHPDYLVIEHHENIISENLIDTGLESEQDEIKESVEAISDAQPTLTEEKIYHGSDPVSPELEAIQEEKIALSQMIFISIGKKLKNQRELLNLSKEDLEHFISIRSHYIGALENGELEKLPSIPQARGMLNNYATFLNLDVEKIMNEFAEGLQTRRNENYAPHKIGSDNQLAYQSPEVKKVGWLKFITLDLLLTSGLIIGLFIFILWGAANISGKQEKDELSEPPSISEILLENTPDLSDGLLATEVNLQLTETTNLDSSIESAGEDIDENDESEFNPQTSGLPVQIYIIARQRSYLKVDVDGKTVFSGRTVPGNAYEYSGSTSVEILTGNAAALEIYYNLNPIGIIGDLGEVKSILFTSSTGATTPTPRFSPTPTETLQPSPTIQLTATPTIHPPTPTPSVTPLIP